MEPTPFLRTQKPATLADLAVIEQQYGFTLPDDYKAHVLRYNGGFPARSSFMEVAPDGDQVERGINSFYAVRHGENTLESSLKSLYDQLHPDLVPFADDGGGDQFCLSVGPKDYGSIYYIGLESYTPPEGEYDEETKTWGPPAPLDYGTGVHFLASSFTAFMNGLVDVPDQD
ncbi:SMI1/KNR4 family protein [Hymenobacter terrenus]|uniref:SMI1/KNR4 family protein n=1 Tax=Hymenobacter terrenus TaxID=1629124 RepID=UPI0006970E96|nr:SMI1/KNR4 family protein [Hymenobacter terrenus]